MTEKRTFNNEMILDSTIESKTKEHIYSLWGKGKKIHIVHDSERVMNNIESMLGGMYYISLAEERKLYERVYAEVVKYIS